MRPVPDDARTVRVEPDTRAGYQALAGYGPWSSDMVRRAAVSLSGHVTPGVSSGPLFGEIRLWLPTAVRERAQFNTFQDRGRIAEHYGSSIGLNAPFECPGVRGTSVGRALEDPDDSESRDIAMRLDRFGRFWIGGVASGFIPSYVVGSVLQGSCERVVDSWSLASHDYVHASGHVPFPGVIADLWLMTGQHEQSYRFCFGMNETLDDSSSGSFPVLPLRPLWGTDSPLDPVTSLGELEWAAVGMTVGESDEVWSQMWQNGHYEISDSADEALLRDIVRAHEDRVDAALAGREESEEYAIYYASLDGGKCPDGEWFSQKVLNWLDLYGSNTPHMVVPCPGFVTPDEFIKSGTGVLHVTRSYVEDTGSGTLYRVYREFERYCGKSVYRKILINDGKWASTEIDSIPVPATEYVVCTNEQIEMPGSHVHFRVQVPQAFLNVALGGAVDADPLASRSGSESESESESGPVRQIQVDPGDLFDLGSARVIFTGSSSWGYSGNTPLYSEGATIDRTSRNVDSEFFVSVPLSSLSPSFTYDAEGLWAHCSVASVLDALPDTARAARAADERSLPLEDFSVPSSDPPELSYARATDGSTIPEILVGPGTSLIFTETMRSVRVTGGSSVSLRSNCTLVARWKFRARPRQ